MKQTRRSFLGTMTGAALCGCFPRVSAKCPVKFIYMADHHIETDFIQSFGGDKGTPVYTCWQPGDHAAVIKTYEFINSDPFCRDAQFALFGGDQINTGYASHQMDLDGEMVNYYRTLEALDLYRNSKGKDVSEFKFTAPDSFMCTSNLGKGQKPICFKRKPLDSRVIAIQGNHDTGVGDFYRECAFQCGDTKIIGFFASYCGLPAPKGQYRSTGNISNGAMDFIEKEMKKAAADPAIRHIVLTSHWAIAPKDDKNFLSPIVDACPANKMNDNRAKLLALAEKYGCDLYINGHEHNGNYPVGKAGCLSNINCGSLTGTKGAWAVVEMLPEKALFHVYSRAIAKEANGKVTFTQLPQKLFVREIPLKPIK